MQNYLIISIIVLLAISALAAVFVANKSNKEPGSAEEKNNLTAPIAVGVIVLLAGLAFLIYSLYSGGETSRDMADDNSFNVAVFIPAWIAIFIPLIVAKNKKKNPLSASQKTTILIILGLTVTLVAGLFVFTAMQGDKEQKTINSFEDCAAAGNPVMESYPRQCRDPKSDRTFTEDIGNEVEKTEEVILNSPRPNEEISSPLKIEGEARGYWFFEGTMPVVLTNWDGLIIAEGYVTSKDMWMTENLVSFEGTIEFTKPDYKDNGSLIIRKSNPSGLPEHDDALEIPIKFK